MNKAIEFLKDGSVTLKKVHSPINGTLTVRWDMISGYQIMGGGLWQVGGPVEMVWSDSLKHVPSDFIPNRILIIGLGGGTIAALARKRWKNAEIVGVDVDEVIVTLGIDYLNLAKQKVEVHIEDAFQFVKTRKDKFDLVFVDTYVGSTFPKAFADIEFLENVKRLLKRGGIAFFNRIYDGPERKEVDKFEKEIAGCFGNVSSIFPYPKELVNIVFLVKK